MDITSGNETRIILRSENPVIQCISGEVFVSRSPGALQDGIKLTSTMAPLDLTGWEGDVYVATDSSGDVRLQGGTVWRDKWELNRTGTTAATFDFGDSDYAYGGDAWTSEEGRERVTVRAGVSGVTQGFNLESGSRVFYTHPQTGKWIEIPEGEVDPWNSTIDNWAQEIRVPVIVPANRVPAGANIVVQTADFVSYDGNYSIDGLLLSAPYPTIGRRAEVTATRTGQNSFRLEGSFDPALSLSAPLTEQSNGTITIGGSNVYNWGTVTDASGSSNAPLVLNTDGTWSLELDVDTATANAWALDTGWSGDEQPIFIGVSGAVVNGETVFGNPLAFTIDGVWTPVYWKGTLPAW